MEYIIWDICTSKTKIAGIPTAVPKSYFFFNSCNSPVVSENSRNCKKLLQLLRFGIIMSYFLFFHMCIIPSCFPSSF